MDHPTLQQYTSDAKSIINRQFCFLPLALCFTDTDISMCPRTKLVPKMDSGIKTAVYCLLNGHLLAIYMSVICLDKNFLHSLCTRLEIHSFSEGRRGIRNEVFYLLDKD